MLCKTKDTGETLSLQKSLEGDQTTGVENNSRTSNETKYEPKRLE